MWCAHCGRSKEECPGGIWVGPITPSGGICVYCARTALRALDPNEAPSVTALHTGNATQPFPERWRRPMATRPEPPDAA